jgi:hypothetical protein
MSQEIQRASELNHSEKVPAAADTAVVLQAGKTAARLSNAGGSCAVAVHPELAFAWALPFIQPIAIVGTVCNQPFRQSADVALTQCVFDQRGLIR